MHFGAHQDLQLLALLVALGALLDARAGAAAAAADPARARRRRDELHPGAAACRAAAGHRARGGAAAAPLLRRLLHLAPRPAREQASDRAARLRPGGDDDGGGRDRRARVDRPAVGGRVRASARSSRRPTRSLRPRSRRASARRGGSSRSSRARASSTTARALVLYKAAVGAAVGGTFSLLDTSGRIVLNVVGGIAIGLAVGCVVRQVRRRVDDPPIEVAIAVLSGYLAYLPAAAAGVSGVLAAVTIGVYMGWHTPELTTERTRLVRRRVLGDPRLHRQRAPVRARRPAAATDRRRRSRARPRPGSPPTPPSSP